MTEALVASKMAANNVFITKVATCSGVLSRFWVWVALARASSSGCVGARRWDPIVVVWRTGKVAFQHYDQKIWWIAQYGHVKKKSGGF